MLSLYEGGEGLFQELLDLQRWFTYQNVQSFMSNNANPMIYLKRPTELQNLSNSSCSYKYFYYGRIISINPDQDNLNYTYFTLYVDHRAEYFINFFFFVFFFAIQFTSSPQQCQLSQYNNNYEDSKSLPNIGALLDAQKWEVNRSLAPYGKYRCLLYNR